MQSIITGILKFFLPALLVLAGCSAHYTVNEKIDSINKSSGYRNTNVKEVYRSDELLIAVAFSGGGTRAAALSYGVLEALRDTEIYFDGKKRRLSDEIDTISAVSGGSFTAAYYGLFGDRIFEDFDDKFLKKDVQGELSGRIWNPLHWLKLASELYDRTEMAAEYYNEHIFENKTFADLKDSGGPYIQINATDITDGTHFVFDQGIFDLLCSNLDSFKIGRAVAASSAVPVLFSSLTINNYAGSCNFEIPPFMKEALAKKELYTRRYYLANKYATYLDPVTKPYIHLYDGGIVDNLGVRTFINRFALHEDHWSALKFVNKSKVKKLLVIVVNAQSELNLAAAKRPTGITLIDTIAGATAIPLQEYSFETMTTLRYLMDQFDVDISKKRCQENKGSMAESDCADISSYLVSVNLDQVEDEINSVKLKHLPTSFYLKPDEVDALVETGRNLLLDSTEFQQFIEETHP